MEFVTETGQILPVNSRFRNDQSSGVRGSEGEEAVARESVVEEEEAMARSLESKAVVRGYCRIKRRDWEIDVQK